MFDCFKKKKVTEETKVEKMGHIEFFYKKKDLSESFETKADEYPMIKESEWYKNAIDYLRNFGWWSDFPDDYTSDYESLKKYANSFLSQMPKVFLKIEENRKANAEFMGNQSHFFKLTNNVLRENADLFYYSSDFLFGDNYFEFCGVGDCKPWEKQKISMIDWKIIPMTEDEFNNQFLMKVISSFKNTGADNVLGLRDRLIKEFKKERNTEE